MIFSTTRGIAIIIASSAVGLIFTSSLIADSEYFAFAKPDKKKHKDIIEKFRERLGDNYDREDEKDDDQKDEEQEVKTNYDYDFVTEGGDKFRSFNFAAAGDFGCTQNAKKTISNMLEKKPELVLPLGDLSVEDNTANCWLDLISPFENKLQITFGYHDINEGVAKIDQYKKVFGLEKLYYSFDYRHVHFIIMSTLSDSNVTSDQYKFIEKDLKSASANENIDWIVVTSYGPFYTSPSEHPAKKYIRNIYHPLFDKYGVDLVLNGHNHNYQRTYPVTFNADKTSKPIVTNTFTTGYNGSSDGVVYAVVGTAGEAPVHPLLGRQPYVATQVAGKFGFLDIEISNGNPHTKMTGTFYDNVGDNVVDYFTIEKEMKNGSNYLDTYTKTTNLLPVESNKKKSDTRIILPSYSDSNEK